MSFNIFETAKSLLNSEFISKAGSLIGENQNSTQKAVDGILPALVGNLIQKSSQPEGAHSLFNLMKDGGHDGGILSNLGSMFGDGGSMLSKGAGLVSSLFGDKSSAITNVIGQFAGIKNSSAGSLMSMVAPAVLGMLGKQTAGTGASGLAATLGDQKSLLSKYMPAGLGSMLGGLGLGNIFSGFGDKAEAVTSSVTSSVSSAANTVTSGYNRAEEAVTTAKSGGTKWLMPLLLLLLAGAAIWYFTGMKGCKPATSTTTGTDSIPAVNAPAVGAETTTPAPVVATVKGMLDSVSGDFTYDLGKMIDIDLPNGAGKINVGEYSTEARLINFLNDKNALIDTAKGNWFEFTNVKFKTGGSEISDASLVQLKNMVMIAKAYPTAQFKIGGYTDNTGNAASNVTLSQKRADAVSAKLVALGAAKTAIVSAKGYGGEWPLADNATAEGRAMNRRVAVNVKSK